MLPRRKSLERRFSIGRYIVDFCCPDCRLVIELDGEAHFSHNIDVYQDRRTKFLEKEGRMVIRFENRELKENLDGVLETIRRHLKSEIKGAASRDVTNHPGRCAATPPLKGGEWGRLETNPIPL